MRKQASLIALVLLAAAPAQAQEDAGETDETLDLTIELMPEGAATPDAVTRIIELPEAVLEAARGRAANGVDEANVNRERRAEGLSVAEEARESAGRGQPPEGVPPESGPPGGGPPDTPGPPDNPGPPGN